MSDTYGHTRQICSCRQICLRYMLETSNRCYNAADHHDNHENYSNNSGYDSLCFFITKVKHIYTSFLKGSAMRIILLPSILVLVWVLHHNLRKSDGIEKHDVRSYLKREDTANSIRRQDISGLAYIKVPLDTLPLDITLNDEKKQLKIAEYKKEITELSKKQMLNLIGMSNIELKELYGPANLEILTIYDQNYSRYIRTLQLLAECIYDEYPERAVSVLEYCLSIGTDISGTYDILGRYYLKHSKQDQFAHLYECIPDSTSISGKVILNKLDSIKKLFF